MKVHGDVSIVAIKDIGSLGPREGSPVIYRWNRAWTLLRFVWYAIVVGWILYVVWLRRHRPQPLGRSAPTKRPAVKEAAQ